MDVMRELFDGINQEQLNVLLPCIDFHLKVYNKGSEVSLEEFFGKSSDIVVAVVSGKVIGMTDNSGRDSKKVFTEGEVIKRMEAISIAEPSTIMCINEKRMIEPCWFSCFFHWKAGENYRRFTIRLDANCHDYNSSS